MPITPEYDEGQFMKEAIGEVHGGWQELREASSRGDKAWLTQIKKHYLRLSATDAEAAG